jgi:hypothetical protein
MQSKEHISQSKQLFSGEQSQEALEQLLRGLNYTPSTKLQKKMVVPQKQVKSKEVEYTISEDVRVQPLQKTPPVPPNASKKKMVDRIYRGEEVNDKFSVLSDEALRQFCHLFDNVQAAHQHKIRSYIKAQALEQIAYIDAQLNLFDDCARNSRILGVAIKSLNEICVEMRSIAERLDEEFLLFIMGSGKNGKSTLVNALLGQERAAVNWLPKTWKIDLYRGAQSDQKNTVIIRSKDGKTRILDWKTAERYFSEEEAKQKESQKNINQAVKTYKENHSVEETEQFKAQQTKYYLYRSDVSEAVWNITDCPILEDYCLADTPGLRQELEADIVIANAKEYYHKADGVIWLLPADKISGITDRSEMEQLIATYGKRTDNMIAVIGKIDKIGDALPNVLSDAERIYKGLFSEFIPVSAKQAVEAQRVMESAEPNSDAYHEAQRRLEESGIPTLIAYLRRTIYGHRAEIQMKSKREALNVLCQRAQEEINTIQTQLSNANTRRIQMKQQWDKICDSLRKTATTGLADDCSAIIQRVRRNVSRAEDKLWELSEAERQRELERIIDTETIRSHLETRLATSHNVLEQNAEHWMQKSAFYEFPALEASKLIQCMQQAESLTIGEIGESISEREAQFAAGAALSIGVAALLGPIGIVAGAIAVTDTGKGVVNWLRKTFSKSFAEKAEDRLRVYFDQVRENAATQYDNSISCVTDHIAQIRDTTYATLYGSPQNLSTNQNCLGRIDDALHFSYHALTLKSILTKEGAYHDKGASRT